VSPVYDVPREQGMRTPRWLFKLLEKTLGCRFALDAFASDTNALCRRYYTERDNGLERPWFDATFANPPFKLMGKAMAKAFYEADDRGVRSAVIGPTGCSQRWFHEIAVCGTILVPDHRLVYLNPDGATTAGAMADTAIYVFGQAWSRAVGDLLIDEFRVRALNVPDAPGQRAAAARAGGRS